MKAVTDGLQDRIKLARESARYSQRAAASALDRSPATVSSWETQIEAQRRSPTFKDVAAMCDLYKTNLDYLILGDDTKAPASASSIVKLPEINHASVLTGRVKYEQITKIPVSRHLLHRWKDDLDNAFILVASGGHLAPRINPGDMIVVIPDIRPADKVPSNELWITAPQDDLLVTSYRFEGEGVQFKTSWGDTSEVAQVYGKAVLRIGSL